MAENSGGDKAAARRAALDHDIQKNAFGFAALRRILGLDGVDADGRTRLKAAHGVAEIVQEH